MYLVQQQKEEIPNLERGSKQTNYSQHVKRVVFLKKNVKRVGLSLHNLGNN